MPPVPSPKVTLTAVPPLKAVKVKVLPLTLPAEAVRPAVKLVAVPVFPFSPSASSVLPVPVMARSDAAPVLICSAPLAAIDELVSPLVVERVAVPLALDAVRTPVARSMACNTSVMVACWR